ncbi:OmpP1/FadL family transporter [Roseinatronobacter sp. S2]|uniref:OmpP1/FadL family transporter n=1 Tax=Roseinatronobacter sp. S2 TaxID=3035471 RepID=UPI00241005DD|nr:outer membrane protein transport protein [Roseinatronobacter sp. S2]WFE74350.1 outer membrane protein transport protein [Roseinatronobacter sp. S2]
MRSYITFGLMALGASPALAGGIERSPQSMNILFQEGNYLEVGATYGAPRVSGNAPGATGNIARNFFTGSIAFKGDINDQLSYAIILDQPFGAGIRFPTGTGADLAGSTAKIDNTTLTGVLRYKFGNGFSAHAGLRSSWTSGSVDLTSLGYTMSIDRDQAWGYLVGVAYEQPEIALRVALTYNSSIKHTFNARETGPTFIPFTDPGTNQTTFSTKIPESVNLEFQTGIAEDTLVFGSVRWVNWKDFVIAPSQYMAFPLASLPPLVEYQKNSVTYTLGVGRRFNENWSGSVSLSHDTGNGSPTSNLGPTGKRNAIGLGASYTKDNMTISGGVQYTRIGSATTNTGGQFGSNSAIGAGIRVGFSF